MNLTIPEVTEKILSSLTEDDLNKKYLVDRLDELSTPVGNLSFYTGLLELFIHMSVDEETAKQHWRGIFDNYENMNEQLDRDIGIRVAIMDYFVNLNKTLKQPIVVEMHVFKETEKLAMLDGLTGLFNRRYFDVNLLKELRRASRYDKDMSILMLDIDNFKQLNDKKGHLFGDMVLKKLSALLVETSRGEDIICRYGGEEFIVILPETNAKGAYMFSERVRNTMKSSDFFEEYGITFSAGVIPYPYGGKTPDELLERVDKALYEAKFSGKNCTVIASVEKRRRERFAKTWKVSYQKLSRRKEVREIVETFTQDVSLGGLCIETTEKFPVETKLLLDIELPTGLPTVLSTVAGEVVWVQKVKETFRYGIQFVDLRAELLHKMMLVLPSDNFDPTELLPI
nr:diguanylate cyclase [Desulfobulbaceae bacterium]